MKKKTICLLLLSLVSITLLATRAGRGERRALPAAAPISLNDVLQAHNVLGDLGVPSSFLAEARRTISAAQRGGIPRSFDRMITVARYGNAHRYQRVDPIARTKQIYAFDGNTTFHAMIVNERLIEQSSREGDSPSEAVGLEIKTFGLLPILRQLSDPNTQAVYQDHNAQGLDRFQVSMSTRNWTVSADSEHLIRSVQSADNAIDYGDYRLVDGIWLPFAQRFYIRGQLYYELSFQRIDLRPELSPDYFNREAFKNIVR